MRDALTNQVAELQPGAAGPLLQPPGSAWGDLMPAERTPLRRPKKKAPLKFSIISDCDCTCIEECEWEGKDAKKCFKAKE